LAGIGGFPNAFLWASLGIRYFDPLYWGELD